MAAIGLGAGAPSNSVRVTRHGALNPSAAVNNPNSTSPMPTMPPNPHGHH